MPRMITTTARCLAFLAAFPLNAEEVEITPDVVYGHKFGLATTFDVFTPKKRQRRSGIIYGERRLVLALDVAGANSTHVSPINRRRVHRVCRASWQQSQILNC